MNICRDKFKEMWEAEILVAFFVFFGFCGVTSSFSVGAGEAACESLQPQHRMAPQLSEAPYSVQVSSGEYAPGQELTGTSFGVLV